MSKDAFVIPTEQLPPGFADRIETPPDPPSPALPAATAVLLRDGDAGLEVLLLRRARETGFVPGAYVFPGGRVDEADDDAGLVSPTGSLPPHPPAPFWIAATRELFEESGVLLARPGAEEGRAPTEGELVGWRSALLEETSGFADILATGELTLSLTDLVHCAHWITPTAEPRRYDTHFFLAALPDGMEARADAREMTDARWVTPAAALAQFREGELPMVFPTVKTIESLVDFETVERALSAFRRRTVKAVEPRLVRTAHGVGIVIDHDEETSGA